MDAMLLKVSQETLECGSHENKFPIFIDP